MTETVDVLLACCDGSGCSLDAVCGDVHGISAVSDHLAFDVDDIGVFDDAPNGISVWEGTVYQDDADGDFRILTDAEWKYLRNGPEGFFNNRKDE